MDAVLRAALIFIVLMVLFRLMGKRTLSQITTFDFILLLVIGEASQQWLLGEDFSLTMAVLVVVTLLLLDRLADWMGYRFPRLDRILDSVPVLLVDEGALLEERMAKSHISEEDILTAARQAHGVESMAEVKYAVLDRDGGISVVPREG